MIRRKQHSKIKGLAAGAIGGLVASWIMGYVHAALGAQQQQQQKSGDGASQPARRQEQQQQQQQAEGEDATVKAAVAIAEAVHREIPPEKKKTAGSLVHYAYGTLVGGLYGMAAEEWRPVREGEGALFGAGLWLVSDEIAVPALKLSKAPRDYPLKAHAGALVSHLVYGVTTELVRRGLRAGVLSR
jgi:putative membrane protein